MLRVSETRVETARFPSIDFHSHLSWSAVGLGSEPYGERMNVLAPVPSLLEVMDCRNLATMVNLTGGVGEGLASVLAALDRAHPGRFLTFTEPSWNAFTRSDFPTFQAEQIEKAHRMGARGLKLTKNLGLYLRERVTEGPLVAVDDPRFDPMWETAGALGIPIAIHVSDPDAFFLPTDRFNERYEELSNHPDWSFHGKDFPSKESLLEARNRVFARHPRTQFVALHVGNRSEDLSYVASCLDRYPNMHVEIGARIGEIGRQPRAAKRFFERYQDRILFGTDAVPAPLGLETPAADLRRRALRDLLPLPRDRGRALRLRSGAGPAAGAMEDLWPGARGVDPEEGLPRQRREDSRPLKATGGEPTLAARSMRSRSVTIRRPRHSPSRRGRHR